MFGKKREQEIGESFAAGYREQAKEHEATAARLEEQADFLDIIGDHKQAADIRSVVNYGRENVIKPMSEGRNPRQRG
jgi:hypothetical protein